MHDGNRGDHTKTGLIAGIVVAALIAVATISWGLWQSAEYGREANNRAREYAAYTDEKVRKACLSLPPVYQKNCATEARHEKRDNERDERDLVAQRQSALWALIMGAAAVVGMGLSVIGVFLVWTTFKETQRAANLAAENLNAFRKFEDAFLSIRFLNCQEVAPGGVEVTFEFQIQNIGRSAAILHAIGVGDKTYEYGNDIIEAGKSFQSRMPIQTDFVGDSLFPPGMILYSTVARRRVAARLHVHVFRYDGAPHVGGRIMEEGETSAV